jgi:hypothetical protein
MQKTFYLSLIVGFFITMTPVVHVMANTMVP